MILERYKRFDIVSFIKSLKPLKKREERLKEMLDEIPEFPNFDNMGIKSNKISDITGETVVKRELITSELREIEFTLSVYDYAKSQLTPDEREIIELFFEPKKAIWRAIEEYSETHYICRGNVYKKRRLALDKMEKIITIKYLK